jgi:FADH2 O2-dependent halogenase
VSERFDVVVVGSGFAGSILARTLAASGRRVVLLERGRHPRFALGESSTPLAAIALERLAHRYDLPDLRALAAYGRWERELPGLRHGLKRGFTFLAHRPGRDLAPAADGSGRLLVAASPSDAVADGHWLRADVDAFLVERAAAAGVDFRDGVELTSAVETADGVELRGSHGDRALAKPLEVRAGFGVDASGGGRFLGRHLPIPDAAPTGNRVATSLLYGHFEGWTPLAEVVDAAGLGPPGPYPDERAAVHHLLEEGWAYVLPFDGYERGGRVSAGIELLGSGAALAGEPESALRRIVGRYPTLAAQLAGARAAHPVRFVPRLQYRLARAAGRRWLLLPHAYAFTSPMFSTGIAWSLVAVERAARMLEAGAPEASELTRYGALLAAEADWIERLVAGAFRALPRFGLFAPWTLLYFAAASYAEAAQRLLDRPEGGEGGAPWCWEGFLGCADPVLRGALEESERHLPRALAAGTPEADAAFRGRVLAAIRERDLCGFDLPERRDLHPVDLDVLVANAHRLGLDRAAVRASLPRLRGDKL